MDEFLSEKEQVEKLRQWWSENGRFIITGLVLGLAILFGWRSWVEYREAQLAAASTAFETLMEAVEQGERDRAFELAAQIQADYSRSPYVFQSALALARLHMEADEPEDAAAQLERALAGSDRKLVQVARLRLARIRLDQEMAQRALDALDAGEEGSFSPLYEETRGDALVALGRPDEARAAYQRALAGMEPGLGDRRLLEMKLADLGPGADAAGGGDDADS